VGYRRVGVRLNDVEEAVCTIYGMEQSAQQLGEVKKEIPPELRADRKVLVRVGEAKRESTGIRKIVILSKGGEDNETSVPNEMRSSPRRICEEDRTKEVTSKGEQGKGRGREMRLAQDDIRRKKGREGYGVRPKRRKKRGKPLMKD